MNTAEDELVGGQAKWSQIVDQIVNTRLKYERKEIDITLQFQNHQRLLVELSGEITRERKEAEIALLEGLRAFMTVKRNKLGFPTAEYGEMWNEIDRRLAALEQGGE